MTTSLIRNTNPTIAPGYKQPDVGKQTSALDKVAYHVQAAMQEMRDDPCGDLPWEQHCSKIYHLLYEAMELVATPPRAAPNKALQSDLAAVMGGCDGTTDVPKMQDKSPSLE